MKCFGLLACALLVCCKGSEDTPYVKIGGEISPSTVTLLQNAPPNVSKVVITSTGGDTLAAIAAARIIKARGYELVVQKYCLSACAQWLMPAAKTVKLEDMPIVGMHHTATALERILSDGGNKAEALRYSPIARVEQQFYDEIGVDRAMLEYPYSQTNPICYWPSGTHFENFAAFAAQWNFVALTKASFISFTGKLPEGNWPETRDDLIKFGPKHFPSTANISIVPESGAPGSLNKLSGLVLPQCNANMRVPE